MEYELSAPWHSAKLEFNSGRLSLSLNGKAVKLDQKLFTRIAGLRLSAAELARDSENQDSLIILVPCASIEPNQEGAQLSIEIQDFKVVSQHHENCARVKQCVQP